MLSNLCFVDETTAQQSLWSSHRVSSSSNVQRAGRFSTARWVCVKFQSWMLGDSKCPSGTLLNQLTMYQLNWFNSILSNRAWRPTWTLKPILETNVLVRISFYLNLKNRVTTGTVTGLHRTSQDFKTANFRGHNRTRIGTIFMKMLVVL